MGTVGTVGTVRTVGCVRAVLSNGFAVTRADVRTSHHEVVGQIVRLLLRDLVLKILYHKHFFFLLCLSHARG